MIADVRKFIETEKPFWLEFEKLISKIENEHGNVLSYKEIKRFYYLFQRVSNDLVNISYSSESEIKTYIEKLVSRAYSEINETRVRRHKTDFRNWLLFIFPETFRKNILAFLISLFFLIAGVVFGAAAVYFDDEAKNILIPYQALRQKPSDRVKFEESEKDKDKLKDQKSSFSAFLTTHNARVSFFIFALGITFGVGPAIMLFYNGVILGAVIIDYIRAGQTLFLCGWLLPHGTVEISAILIAGQASFIFAGAMFAFKNKGLKQRIFEKGNDLIALISGCAALLIWAGIIESFFSQYHHPVLPYNLKIIFGIIEFLLLYIYLFFSKRRIA
ncbi:MAG TPA: stage II sporulation protein M [bacterium]|nr:stage II sporulation protein M [bacterium]HPN30058.1 stage II sporulation protein M [bacterium]